MTPRRPATADIDTLVAQRLLQRLPEASLGVPGLMTRSEQELRSAQAVLESDPATAYVIAYDAVKHAGMALLARQGLRATARGGHVAIERALGALYGDMFRRFRALRQRRHELDYPAGPDDFADVAEAAAAIEQATGLVAAAAELLSPGGR